MGIGEGVTSVLGLLAMMVIWAMPLAIVIWPIILVIRALNRTAAAHESAARALEQIAGYLARKA